MSSIEYIIKPHQSWLKVNLKEIWLYRDLLWLLVKRDFVAFYKQTIFGPLWFFIQPLFTTIIFTFLFDQLAGISTEGVPAPLFYMCGITLWNYFADCLTKTSTVFKDNAPIFGKVYFPRLIMPLSIVVSNLVRFGVQFLLLMGFWIYYLTINKSIQPNYHLLLFPWLLLMMALLGLGLGMIISALTTKYRDLSFLITFGVQLMMYATTVAYPLSAAPEKYKFWIALNPMTTLIETFRYGWLGQGSFNWSTLLIQSLVVLFVLGIGTIIFNKVEKNFMDTV